MGTKRNAITGRDVPQANSLGKVREVVAAVHAGDVSGDEMAEATSLSSRHLKYYQRAALVLGVLRESGGELRVTRTGEKLLESTPGSREEGQVWREAIESSPILRIIAPELLGEAEPNRDAVVKRIVRATDLGEPTATRRADGLLAWRRQLVCRQQELFQPPVLEVREPRPVPHVEELQRPLLTLTRLHLRRFKGFLDATVEIGPFTLLLGTNASGKSNIRDAFRFLHGLARGYTLADTLGEKWGEGGVLEWRGLRGGAREAAFEAASSFEVQLDMQLEDRARPRNVTYRIEVDVGGDGSPPRVARECLVVHGVGQYIFDSHPESNQPDQSDPLRLAIRVKKQARKGYLGPVIHVLPNRPALPQLVDHSELKEKGVREYVRHVLDALRSMRFVDLSPDSLRLPSHPGQTILGDRGENLSSVLYAISADERQRRLIARWIAKLTPLDTIDLEFPIDHSGKVLVTLVESSGARTSAYSASDGTLRFLAMLAVLFGPQAERFLFFEELENGIHPTRIYLLLEVIESLASKRRCQVVATTHSPHLLASVSHAALEHCSILFRPEGARDQRVRRILDVPDTRRVIEKNNVGELLADGWLENAMAFASEGEEP